MTRRVFITGAGGFIGQSTARILRATGDEVVAVVRHPDQESGLRDLGVELVQGDLGSATAIREAMTGAEAVIHLAGSYRVGIAASERPAMYEANVAVTERVMDAAISQGIPRIAHISTVNAFGNTRGRVADESYRRREIDPFLSYYDETKYLAHVAVGARIAAGAPVIIAQLGTVYGRGDHSSLGAQLKAAFDGTARYVGFGDLGISPAHVDDIAAGIVAVLDRGRIGETYVLSGDNMRLFEAMAVVARAAGRKPPRIRIPTGFVRLVARIAPGGGRLLGVGPNFAEVVRSADGVTFWASHAKASTELGYAPRDLATGARDAFGPA